MSIYHLHIPRTSGVYVRSNILPKMVASGYSTFASNRTTLDTSFIASCDFVSGHFGRMPIDYMNNPIVYCLIRDPLERWISYFKYTTGIMRDSVYIKDKLENWLYGEQAEIQSNMQSKFITGSIDVEEFNKHINATHHKINNGWFIKDYSLDKESVINRADEIKIFSTDNLNLFISDINKSLEKNYAIKINNNYKVNESRDINLNLSKTEINRILELNSLDIELYEYIKTKERNMDNRPSFII